MKELTLRQIATWCGGWVSENDADIVISGICRSSSDVKKGDLFVALQGQRFDGHSFIAEAIRNGASAVLSMYPAVNQYPTVVVSDTLTALGDIAAGYRKTLSAKVYGITGSVGKTTTKEMLAQILSMSCNTGKTQENYNNNIGLPLTIMNTNPDCEALVLEMGMNHFGEMSRLTQIAQPDVVIIGNIGTMHIEHLGSREGILKAKLEILEGIGPDGIAIFNGDEPMLWDLRDKISCHILYFSLNNKKGDVQASAIRTVGTGIGFHVHGLGADFDVTLPVDGRHNVYNAMAAITAALKSGVQPETIQSALAVFSNTGMRQNTYKKFGYTIIDDCYNAGPESVEAALHVLFDRRGDGRKIAVLGDMLELGNRASAEHFRIGRIAAHGVDYLLTYGPEGQGTVTGAWTGGMDAKHAMNFSDREELVNMLCFTVQPGDVLLFKGSRGMKMEEILHLFLDKEKNKDHPEDDE